MSQIKRKKRRRNKRRYYRALAIRIGICVVILVILISLVVTLVKKIFFSKDETEDVPKEPEVLTTQELLEKTAKENDFSVEDYPEQLIELLEKNPEAEEYVLNYPLKKGTYTDENLKEPEETSGLPLLIQWDDRWGYFEYADNVMGLAGCGPTSLSMVASYLLDDPSLTPIYMAEYAMENGHSIDGGGTAWSLMNEGARALGLNPKEVPLDENAIKKHLENGRPIICNVGEGIFTDNGHYMVFAGWEDGKIKINDPNRREYSARLWSFEEIQDQIKNMWVY